MLLRADGLIPWPTGRCGIKSLVQRERRERRRRDQELRRSTAQDEPVWTFFVKVFISVAITNVYPRYKTDDVIRWMWKWPTAIALLGLALVMLRVDQ